jgi:hypothetical protein
MKHTHKTDDTKHRIVISIPYNIKLIIKTEFDIFHFQRYAYH